MKAITLFAAALALGASIGTASAASPQAAARSDIEQRMSDFYGAVTPAAYGAATSGLSRAEVTAEAQRADANGSIAQRLRQFYAVIEPAAIGATSSSPSRASVVAGIGQSGYGDVQSSLAEFYGIVQHRAPAGAPVAPRSMMC